MSKNISKWDDQELEYFVDTVSISMEFFDKHPRKCTILIESFFDYQANMLRKAFKNFIQELHDFAIDFLNK